MSAESKGSVQGSPVKGRLLWILGIIAAVALLLSGTAQTQNKQAAPAKSPAPTAKVERIRITPGTTWDSRPSVDKPSVTLDKSAGDEAEWYCSDGCDFDVVFVESMKPFRDRAFNKQKNKSGRPTGAPGTYKYIVIVGGGRLDPDVIIRGGGG